MIFYRKQHLRQISSIFIEIYEGYSDDHDIKKQS